MLDSLLLFTIAACLLCCPFTKVEESFNMQAISDLHQYGTNIDMYDHLEFPGVVPRTFVGAIVVYVFSFPIDLLIKQVGLPRRFLQIGCRFLLGFLCWLAFLHFKSGVRAKFGKRAGEICAILMSLQFHLCFYMSRTLPNTFALMCTLVAFGYWLKGSAYKAICTVAFGMVIFRCDLLILLGPMTLQLLLSQEVYFFKGLVLGVLTCLLSLGITVGIDSLAWKQLVWPEGIVLFYNTVENKSSDWGVSPFHWYITNALPKALNVSLLWILCGIAGIKYPKLFTVYESKRDPSTVDSVDQPMLSTIVSAVVSMFGGLNTKLCYYVLPAVCFVGLYSILPHKELRFLFPVMPLFVMAGAVGLHGLLPAESKRLWYPFNMLPAGINSNSGEVSKAPNKNRVMTWFNRALSAILLLTTVLSIFLLSTFLSASIHNYAGGDAMERLLDRHIAGHLFDVEEAVSEVIAKGQFESLKGNIKPIFVHIDVLAATSGVTRFLHEDKKLSLLSSVLHKTSPTSVTNNYVSMLPSSFNYDAFYDQACFKHGNNANPSEELLNQVLLDCSQVSMVYYSKDEHVSDYSEYDWLIDEVNLKEKQESESSSVLWKYADRFVLAEEVKGFNKMRFSFHKSIIPVQTSVELKTMLYIYYNNRSN